MKIGDLVEILPSKRLKKKLHGRQGVLVGLVGDVSPFLWEVKSKNLDAIVGGDELKLVESAKDTPLEFTTFSYTRKSYDRIFK